MAGGDIASVRAFLLLHSAAPRPEETPVWKETKEKAEPDERARPGCGFVRKRGYFFAFLAFLADFLPLAALQAADSLMAACAAARRAIGTR